MKKEDKYKILQCKEIKQQDMEYGKHYAIIDWIVVEPNTLTDEYWIRAMYWNSCRRLSDDEIILKIEIQWLSPYWESLIDKYKDRKKLLDTLPKE